MNIYINNCELCIFYIALSNPVTITSNVTLHDGVICYNQPIELTCHASGINVTMYKWTSSKFSNLENSASITVIAKEDSVQYTCTVSDSNGDCGYFHVNVSSSGKKLLTVVFILVCYIIVVNHYKG